MTTLAVFNATLNPPGLHHRRLVMALAAEFDRVVVVPCGPQPYKPTADAALPSDRAAMADLTFADAAKVDIDLFDLENDKFTRTHELDARYAAKDREVWHAVGAEQLRGGGSGHSVIHRLWERGPQMWDELQFAVVLAPGERLDPADLPPRHRRVTVDTAGSSAHIRGLAFERRPIDGVVVPRVAAYARRRNLYRGGPPAGAAIWQPGTDRMRVVFDERNERARAAAGRFTEAPDPDLIVVAGGDGTMLHAIRTHWRQRRAFYGVNAGHLGFLLNEGVPPGFPACDLALYHLPMLRAEVVAEDGSRSDSLAFNDAWVERADGQTAWIEVRVNGAVQIERLVADGALVATAAGSTSYARAMGAPPLPLHTRAMVLAGSNVLSPAGWRPVVLAAETEVTLTSLGGDKRPMNAYVDGVPQGRVRSLSVRASRTAGVELAFDPANDLVARVARLQFPRA